MEAYLLDWLNLLLRWAHVIVGIAWIGASFYFIWLDDRLEPSRDPRLAGELWAIHGGGFYRAEKYKLGPAQLPATLHWFKWEAYWTWITGFALHVIIPGQRRMVEAVSEGREPDPKDAAMGKQRSVHNTYFTLPVVFVMISNHYAMTFGHRWSWLLLVAMTLAGALIRVWFVLRH